MEHFKTLFNVNVNDHKEEKNGLSYLSWTYAWAEIKKAYPDATYEVVKQDNGLPYVFDPNTGYMVFTRVTIEGLTHEMWLPVMDSANNAMKAEPYTCIKRKYGKDVEVSIQAATMFDINKTIMRCLVKNLAMFGLGLYIYSGEDLPESEKKEEPKAKEEPKDKPKEEPKVDPVKEADARTKVLQYINQSQMSPENIQKICKCYKVEKITDLNLQQCNHYLAQLEKHRAKEKEGKENE